MSKTLVLEAKSDDKGKYHTLRARNDGVWPRDVEEKFEHGQKQGKHGKATKQGYGGCLARCNEHVEKHEERQSDHEAHQPGRGKESANPQGEPQYPGPDQRCREAFVACQIACRRVVLRRGGTSIGNQVQPQLNGAKT